MKTPPSSAIFSVWYKSKEKTYGSIAKDSTYLFITCPGKKYERKKKRKQRGKNLKVAWQTQGSVQSTSEGEKKNPIRRNVYNEA